jgi:hypothetical protein
LVAAWCALPAAIYERCPFGAAIRKALELMAMGFSPLLYLKSKKQSF